ncbi:MAG: ATP-binding protein [Pseudomonadota bacterium]
MATFKQLVEQVDPVQPSIRFGAVLARFASEKSLEVLPVVFGRTLVGCLYRRTVFELAGSDIPREHLNDARITPLLDESPVTADCEARVGGFCARSAKGDGKALASGVVVLEKGAYAGVVRPRTLARALAEENARRAKSQKALVEDMRALRADQAAEQENQAKMQALLAHELRTPLNAALASADMLLHHAQSSDGKVLARTVASACDGLDRLLDDMMVISQSGLDQLPVKPEPISLKRLVADIEVLWSPQCSAKGLGFDVRIGKLAADRIEIDPTRLTQVTNNLVSNAIKYTEAGRIDVTVDTTNGPDGLDLSIEVRDTGPGLANDEQATVFLPFARASKTEDLEGTGLGLTVAKAVMESLGGSLSYRDADFGGSVFAIRLPVRKAGPRVITDNRRTAAIGRFKVGDVLLIEDHEPSRLVMAKALTAAGWQVDGVHTLAQALRRVTHKPYQAILCDLHLPDGDGTDLLKKVRAGDGINPSTPVVAVTADRSEARIEACTAAGFDTIWTKPIRPNDAAMALADLIMAHEAKTGAARAQALPQTPPEALSASA